MCLLCYYVRQQCLFTKTRHFRSCTAQTAADNVKTLFARSRQGQCLIKAGMEGPCHKSLQLRRANSALAPAPPHAVWLAWPFFLRLRSHFFCKYTNLLSNHLYHMFLQKRTDSSRPHNPLHLPFPHLKGLQFLKLLSVICVVFILVSLEMSCQTTAFGNSVSSSLTGLHYFLFLTSTSS